MDDAHTDRAAALFPARFRHASPACAVGNNITHTPHTPAARCRLCFSQCELFWKRVGTFHTYLSASVAQRKYIHTRCTYIYLCTHMWPA